MVTDNWPADFMYISRRLTRQIVDQNAVRRRRNPLRSLTFGTYGVGVTADLSSGPVDKENMFELVKRATSAVSDNTGTLEVPGQYIRADVEVCWDEIGVFAGWDRSRDTRIAAFFADLHIPGVGGVFLALFGSMANFVGYRDDRAPEGWMPSDVNGLYRMLDESSEPGDPSVAARELQADKKVGMQTRVNTAATLYHHLRPPMDARMDVLAKCYYVGRDVDLSWSRFRHGTGPEQKYDLVILGTPIWVATAEPGPA